MSALLEELVKKDVVVCAGSGGVGKTTVSASLGLALAGRGKKTCVLTIDPAKRLSDALGGARLGNEPTEVGAGSGFYAAMLDPKKTFDDLIIKYSRTEEQAQRILNNQIYKALSTQLGGIGEYMACERLWSLHSEGGFDVVVVDTPPSKTALDFLESPTRLKRFLENRILRILLMPNRFYARTLGLATRTLIRSIAKVAGAEIVSDAIDFVQAFEGMEEGFRERAGKIDALLASESTAYLLIAAPRYDAVMQASSFARALQQKGRNVTGVVLNRVMPQAVKQAALDAKAQGSGPLEDLEEALLAVASLSAREEELGAKLAESAGPGACVVRVESLAQDVHDIAGLQFIADRLGQ